MPIIDIQRRLHQAGRIRLGDKQVTKTGKLAPAKLSQFRFTSSDHESLAQVAAAYGGDVVPWDGNGSGDKYELYTSSTILNVIIPPLGLDSTFSQWYEDWTSGVCRHRCDGQDDIKTDHPCSCDPENRLCKPTTRIAVILQEVAGIGTWRLETHGFSGASEIGGTIELLKSLDSTKPTRARLLLREEVRKVLSPDGKVTTNRFVVPVLDPILSVAQLTGGAQEPRQIEAHGVTPIATIDDPTLSIAEQLQASSVHVESPKRANAAPTVPPTGLKPHGYVPPVDDDSTQPATQPSVKPYEPPTGAPLLTEPQGRNIGRLFGKIKITDRDERLEFLADHFGHPFESSKQLLKSEATELISYLMVLAGEEEKPRQQAPTPPEPSTYDEYSEEQF